MNKKILKNILLIIGFIFTLFLFSNSVEAASVSISLSKTTASPGEQITGSISSDCVGRVNLSVTNGSISTDRVWIEGGAQSFTITVGTAGTTSISASPEGGKMSDGGVDVDVSGASAVISVAASSNTGGNTSTSNGNTGTSSSGSTPTSGGSTTTTQKSSNANLANFGIRPNDFTGFSPSKTEYTTTVPNDVTSVEVYASKAQNGQTITGTGTKELQEGSNTFKVVVTAEDGKTQKTYTLTVNREASDTEETPTEETPEEGATEATEGFGLASLEIEGVELSPRFSTDVYEYTAKYTGDATQLNITTTPTEEGTTVEITGNENLVDGENVITVLVTDSSGDKTVAYQLTVQKQTVDEEAIAKQEELERQQEIRKYILIGGVVFLVLIIIIILIIMRRRNRRLAEEYMVPYSGLDDEEDYDDDNDGYQKITKKFMKKDNNDEDNPLDDEDKANQKSAYLDQFDNDNWFDKDDDSRKKHNKGKRFK